jgi:aerobic carbon-monoxide dehydrogenase large subunit
MVNLASKALVASLKELAADKLEAAVADLEIADGGLRIAGTDRAISYAEIAAVPGATEAKLMAVESSPPPKATYPNGTHACEVEIDPETGTTTIVRYTIVDDFGFTLNPLLLAGQVHGGIAQGVGQALIERAVYDESGQLLTATLQDYCVPRADNLLEFNFETRNVPSTTNLMGLKGAGEAGSIGSTPAVVNAVLEPCGAPTRSTISTCPPPLLPCIARSREPQQAGGLASAALAAASTFETEAERADVLS